MRRTLTALLLLLGLAVALPAPAQFQAWEGSEILQDPEWRKRFLGSYGFLSGAEPQIAPGELAVLREVIDLMKVNPRAAATMLEQKVTPESSAAFDFILANLHFQNGNLPGAASSYASALDKFPDFRRAHKNMGLLLVQRGEFLEAAGHLTRAIELGDRDGRNFGLLGYCYLQVERYLAAEQAYRNAILQQPGTRDWKLGLARALLATEQYRDAVSLFDELIETDPESHTAWLLQANAYIGLEQPEAAAVNLEAVRMLGKADASSLILLGDIYMNAGMTELAKNAYLEVIEKDAANVQFATAYRAADLLIRTGAWGDADDVLQSIDARYTKTLGVDDELKVLTLQAKLARAQGRKAEAAKILTKVVDQDGTRGDALLELADYYKTQGNEERALLLIERAQNLEAYEYPALLANAQLRVSGRDYARAAQLLREALKIRNEPRVEQFLARVEQAIRR